MPLSIALLNSVGCKKHSLYVNRSRLCFNHTKCQAHDRYRTMRHATCRMGTHNRLRQHGVRASTGKRTRISYFNKFRKLNQESHSLIGQTSRVSTILRKIITERELDNLVEMVSWQNSPVTGSGSLASFSGRNGSFAQYV